MISALGAGSAGIWPPGEGWLLVLLPGTPLLFGGLWLLAWSDGFTRVGEFTVAGKRQGADYLCAPVPGSGRGHVFTSDAFLFFKVAQNAKAQADLAKVFMDKDAQVAFSLAKGSVPVRTDADVSKFDDCAKQSHADLVAGGKDGTAVATPNLFQSPARIAAWRDVVLSFWNDDSITPQEAALSFANAAKANR